MFTKIFRDRRPMCASRRISLANGGFVISQDDTELAYVRWESVAEIVVWKNDLFSYDEICIGFRLQEDDRIHIITESDQGYSGIQSELVRHFDGVSDDWWRDVAFPPFAENMATIWKRTQ